MKFQTSITTAILVLGLAPAAIWAQKEKEKVCPNGTTPTGLQCYIDNFKTGSGKIPPITSGTKSLFQADVPGAIGGNREFQIGINESANPFNQTVTAQVIPSQGAFITSWGFGASGVTSLTYGQNSPYLNLDLTPYYGLLVTFNGLEGGADFDLAVFDASDNDAYCALYISTNENPFTVEFPISQFSSGGITVNFGAIGTINLQFGAADSPGNPSFGITAVEAIPAPVETATYVCAPPSAVRPRVR